MNRCACGRNIRGSAEKCKSCAKKAGWAVGSYSARRQPAKTQTEFYRVGYDRIQGGSAGRRWPPLIPLTEWGDDAA